MLYTSPPFRAKLLDTANRVIRTKINVYDTKMAVKSKGIPFEMYSDQTWTTRILPADSNHDYCVMPNLSLNWSYSAPFWMSVDEFSIDTGYCYFMPEQASSSFGFYVLGNGVTVDAWMGGAQRITSETLTHSPSIIASAQADNISSGWYQIRFRFNGISGIRNGGIVVLYTYNYTGDFQADKNSCRILNAGVCSPTNAWAESASVSGHNNIKGRRIKNEPTTYSFDLPYGDTAGGYYKNSDNFYTNGSARLQEGMLIEIFAGYELDATPLASQTEGLVEGDVEYLPRFTGYISGFQIDRANNTITVNCRDFFGIAESSFCINYPNASSYWGAGYVQDAVAGEPYGLMAPIAYDRWNVVSAVKDLFVRAGLPASRFYDMEVAREAGDGVVETVPSVYDGGFLLEFADYYGTDQAKEYANTFDLGTTVHEAIMKLTDTYGYFIDFKPNGNLRFHPTNNATADTENNDYEARLDEQNQVYSGGSRQTSTEHLGGGYRLLTDTDDYITFDNPGDGTHNGIPATGFSLIVERNSDCGASDNNNNYWQGTASVRVEIIEHGGGAVRTYNYNFYFSERWLYNDGISPLVGTNPCLINLDHNLLYGNYDVKVTNLNGTYNIRVDELWVYHRDVSTPQKLLQTYRIVNQAPSIRSVDFERNIEDTRNDILTVGQRKGYWVAGGGEEAGLDDPEFSSLENAQYTNYNFRAMDVESIYNPNATNYTGRHLMTYIQEPNIYTDQRAQWLSHAILSRYRGFDKRININVIGDPEVTIGDPITMIDKLEENATNLVWIQGIDESITKDDWNIGLEVIGKEPFPSYDQAQDYDVEQDWNGRFFSDFTLSDGYGYSRDGTKSTTISGDQSWGASSLTVSDTVTSWPSAMSLVIYNEESSTYGVIITSATSGTTITVDEWVYISTGTGSGYGRQQDNIIRDGWTIANIYNPYEEADYGNFFTVSFRCLVEGYVYIGVKSMDGVINFINGLSSGGGLDESNLPKEERVSAGDVITKIWGGVDSLGVSHEVQGEDNDIGGGFFAEPGRYEIVVQYTRAEDNLSEVIHSGSYTDEDGATQNQSVEIALSGMDQIVSDFTYDSGLGTPWIYPVWTSGTTWDVGTEVYSPGGDGRRIVNTSGEEENINAVWTRGTDGNINIALSGYYINSPRKYFVTYWVRGKRSRFNSGSSGTGTTDRINWDDVELVGGDGKQLSDGNAISCTVDDSYVFPFDPELVQFGGWSVDNDFVTFENENEDTNPFANDYGNHARGYFIRLILDIRDGSGRKNVTRNGTVYGRRNPNIDLNVASRCIYTDWNWNEVFEWYVVPTKIDQDTNYSNNFHTMNNVAYLMPYFEADTPVPLSYINYA